MKTLELMPTINWVAQKKSIGVRIDGSYKVTPNFNAMVRSDNNEVLSIVKKCYNPFSNEEFMDMTHELSRISEFAIQGFQEIKDGKIILGYLKNADKDFTVAGCKIEDYLVFGNSFNCETALFTASSSVVLRCMNQYGRIHQLVRIIHRTNMQEKVKELTRYFENYFVAQKAMYAAMNHMADVKIDPAIIEEMINFVLKLDKFETKDEIPPQRLRKVEEMRESINAEIIDLGDNAWGLFNGVTHFTTHKLSGRLQNDTIGNIYGVKNHINQRAFQFASNL